MKKIVLLMLAIAGFAFAADAAVANETLKAYSVVAAVKSLWMHTHTHARAAAQSLHYSTGSSCMLPERGDWHWI